MVADHRGAQDDRRLRKHHEMLIHSGAEFTSNYRNIVEGLLVQLYAAAVRQILKRALDVHATALLLVSARAEAATGDADFLARLRQAGGAVSVGVHDHVLWDGAEIFSTTKRRFV
jgi:hypothetical protein